METCRDDKGFIDNMFKKDRYLKNQVKSGKTTMENAQKEFIEKFIDNELKFPDVDEIIDKINIKIDYYDISDELLYNNEDFEKIIEELDIECRECEEGYTVKGY